MVAALALAETEAAAAALPADALAVALAPQAQLALEQHGRAFLRPEDGLGEPELEARGRALYPVAQRLCEAIDADVRRAWPRRAPFAPASWRFFAVKTLLDGLVLRGLQLHGLVERERPQRLVVVAHDSVTAPPTPPGLHGSLYGAVARELGVPVDVLPARAAAAT